MTRIQPSSEKTKEKGRLILQSSCLIGLGKKAFDKMKLNLDHEGISIIFS